MQRLRVLIFSLDPHGGFHHYSAALCNAIVKCTEIESLCYLLASRMQGTFGTGSEEHEIVAPAVHVAYLAPAGRLTRLRKYLLFLRNLIYHMQRVKQGTYDVIHLQTGTSSQLLNLIVGVWYRSAGIPIVRTVHEIHMAERGHGLGRCRRWLAHLELRLANHLIVHDTFMCERLCRVLGWSRNKLTVIPHGNYLGFRKHLPEAYEHQESQQSSQPPLILFFGVKRHKGLAIFLQAWRMIQAEGHALRALLAGTVNPAGGELIEETRRLPGIEVQAGYIPNSDVWRYFARASCVAMPYLVGTTSGAIHLAYAFKRPVIVSDLDCFKEMVIPGKTGLVVPKGDPVALKEAILQLGKDPDRCREMGEAGFQLESSRRYEWDVIAAQTVEVYRRMCGASARKKRSHP